MIQVNLLPPEHRAAQGTPVSRFVAIVAGVVLFVGASCAYVYTHFIQLKNVQDLLGTRKEEVASKERQRDRSIDLQKEIDEKQKRRDSIQAINRSRILWSRKLDQFFDLVAGADAPYSAWIEELEVPPQLGPTGRRAGAVAGQQDGGKFTFGGYLAMESANEAPAQNSSFYKALTGEQYDVSGKSSEFFTDFVSISNPTIDIVSRQGESHKLSPPITAAFKYELRLKFRGDADKSGRKK